MDNATKSALLAKNLPLVLWTMKHGLAPREIERLGGADDTRQLLCVLFYDACDVVERKGFTIGTVFPKLVRYRLDEMMHRACLVRPSRTPRDAVDCRRKAAHAMQTLRPLSVSREAWRQPRWELDDADAQEALHRRLRTALPEALAAVLVLRFGLHGHPPHTYAAIGRRLGMHKGTVWNMERRALDILREEHPDLADLL